MASPLLAGSQGRGGRLSQEVSRAKGSQWAEPRRERLLGLRVGVEQAPRGMWGRGDQSQHLINPELPMVVGGRLSTSKIMQLLLARLLCDRMGLSIWDAALCQTALLSVPLP